MRADEIGGRRVGEIGAVVGGKVAGCDRQRPVDAVAARMGADRVTVRNLKVLKVDADNNLLVVEGGIPGAPTGYVIVRKAVAAKKLKVAQVEKPKKAKK